MLFPGPEKEEIDYTDSHHGNSSSLTHCIGGKAHEQREEGAAKKAHNHQSADLILLVASNIESTRKTEREDIGVAIADKGDGRIKHPQFRTHPHACHGKCHHHNTDEEEGAVTHLPKDEAAGETSYRTENEIERCGKGSLVKSHAKTLDKELGGSGISAHINAHVTHDAKEAEQNEWVAQQFDGSHERGGLALGAGFINFGDIEQQRGQNTYY